MLARGSRFSGMKWPVILLSVFVTVACAAPLLDEQRAGGAPRDGSRYTNTNGSPDMEIGAAIQASLTTPSVDKSPSTPIPLRALSKPALLQQTDPVLYRLGHSTILIKLGDHFVLTDPVFSERASPLQWVGPRRFHPAPIDIGELPHLSAVVISHDHYDHLDSGSIVQLAERTDYFVTPLGVGRHLRAWGVAEESIIELDWWEEVEIEGLELAATPAQHFSGRGLLDRNSTLWASWVIRGDGVNLFFSGDTGYFDGFREIGERYGPFDVTMIENGAYNLAWRDVHMLPQESVQAHIDLRGGAMLPIHNSTFDLSLHSWYEPLEKVSALTAQQGIELLTPVIGAPVYIRDPQPTFAWWREEVPEQRLAALRAEACGVC